MNRVKTCPASTGKPGSGLRNLQAEMCRCSFLAPIPICTVTTTDRAPSFYFPFLQLWFDFSCRVVLAGVYGHPDRLQLLYLGRVPGARAAGGGCAYVVGKKGFEPRLSLLGESSSSPMDRDG